MDASATTQISRLQSMGLEELRAEYEMAFGKATKSRNRKQLFTQIARKMQGDDIPKPTLTVKFEPKKGQGGKAKKTGEKKSTRVGPIGARDPRLPKAGTTIERDYKGKKHLVRVLEEGFEYDGKPFRSLSAVAMAITGAKAINGFLWFRLGDYAKKEKPSK